MELINVTKKYSESVIFDNFSYKFEDHKITAILGDSGVGKTTLINMILGLTTYSGDIKFHEKIACVFQNDRLIPSLTVKENLLLVNPKIDIENELKKFNLIDAMNYYPSMLSAGMSRRVAILRALNFDSNMLIMDEPLRNLDYALKFKIMDEIKKYHKNTKNTIIIVTHDIGEALELGDNILILKNNSSNPIAIKNEKNLTEKDILKVLIDKK